MEQTWQADHAGAANARAHLSSLLEEVLAKVAAPEASPPG